MAAPIKLADADIHDALRSLPGWKLEAGKLHARFQFKNFIEAFGFMTRVALVAETMGHHPEWSNIYNVVIVHLSTHDAGGITQKDFDLAAQIQVLAGC